MSAGRVMASSMVYLAGGALTELDIAPLVDIGVKLLGLLLERTAP